MDEWPVGIRPDGDGLRIRIWHKGRLYYSETLKGDPYSPSHLAAAKNRREWLIARKKLGLPLVEGGESEQQVFEDVAQQYIDTLDAKRSTHMSYEHAINKKWMPVFAGWPVAAITAAKIRSTLMGFPVSNKTRKNLLIPLRGILDYAQVHPNPAAGIRLKRSQKPEVDRYTPGQRAALMASLRGQAAVYFAVLFGCGLRPGEALGLDWSDYDGEYLDVSKQITRRRLEPSTKTSMRRRVYVPKWVREYLNGHTTRFKKGYIFQNTKGGPHLDTDVFNGAWRKAHTKARIPYRIPYTCRHTRAAELLSTGVNPADAAKQLGHSMEMFLRTYSEWIEEYAKDRDDSRFEGHTDDAPTTEKPEKWKA